MDNIATAVQTELDDAVGSGAVGNRRRRKPDSGHSHLDRGQ